MRKMTAIIAVLLAGCSTTIREIRSDDPRAAYQSARSIPQLQHCLTGNLSWISQPAVIPDQGETEISFGGSGDAAVLITLRQAGAGSTVEVREKLGYGARVRHNVEECVGSRRG